MRIITFAALALLASSHALAEQLTGFGHCAKQIKLLSKGNVNHVPYTPDLGNEKEHYFAWNTGSNSKPLLTDSGYASASCTINKRTGSGFITLNGKNLGAFKAKLK